MVSAWPRPCPPETCPAACVYARAWPLRPAKPSTDSDGISCAEGFRDLAVWIVEAVIAGDGTVQFDKALSSLAGPRPRAESDALMTESEQDVLV